MQKTILVGAAIFALTGCQSETAPVPAAEETQETGGTTVQDGGDALVEGTEYNATAQVTCSVDGIVTEGGCNAGIKRNWDEDGGSLVEVTKADGFKRAIFIDAGGVAYGADSSEADGSAGWEFTATHDGEIYAIDFGPEHYEFPDALVTGG